MLFLNDERRHLTVLFEQEEISKSIPVLSRQFSQNICCHKGVLIYKDIIHYMKMPTAYTKPVMPHSVHVCCIRHNQDPWSSFILV